MLFMDRGPIGRGFLISDPPPFPNDPIFSRASAGYSHATPFSKAKARLGGGGKRNKEERTVNS